MRLAFTCLLPCSMDELAPELAKPALLNHYTHRQRRLARLVTPGFAY